MPKVNNEQLWDRVEKRAEPMEPALRNDMALLRRRFFALVDQRGDDMKEALLEAMAESAKRTEESHERTIDQLGRVTREVVDLEQAAARGGMGELYERIERIEQALDMAQTEKGNHYSERLYTLQQLTLRREQETRDDFKALRSLLEQTPAAFVELVKPFVEKLKRDDATVNDNFERIREAVDNLQARYDNGMAELEAMKQVTENLTQDFNRWYDRLAEQMANNTEAVAAQGGLIGTVGRSVDRLAKDIKRVKKAAKNAKEEQDSKLRDHDKRIEGVEGLS